MDTYSPASHLKVILNIDKKLRCARAHSTDLTNILRFELPVHFYFTNN